MNSKRPKISVVIPAYNEEEYLPACLQAFRKQVFTDFEIIVVDNNSTDKTAEIAAAFGAKVVKESKQGMIPARERGFNEAAGEIIARTDADTIVSPSWLRIIAQQFDKHPGIAAITGTFTSPSRYIPSIIFKMYTRGFVALGRVLTGHTHLHGPNFAVRKAVWIKAKPHLEDLLVHEDIDLACHLIEFGDIQFVPSLETTYSLRRLKNNFFKTAVDYPARYIRTILLHHPRLRRRHLGK